VLEWQGQLGVIRDNLPSPPTREALDAAAKSAKSATETLHSSLHELGRPEGEASQQARDDVSQLEDQLEADRKAIAAAIGEQTPVQATATIRRVTATARAQIQATAQ